MSFYCLFCQRSAEAFLPFGIQSEFFSSNQVIGGGYRNNALCPTCQSLDRERMIYLYLKEHSELFNDQVPLSVLHMAPEKNLQRALKKQPNLRYTSADMSSPMAQVKADLTQLPFKAETFDFVICNHVLEHIPDEKKALAEIYRVLRTGGQGILQVPIAAELAITYEDASIVSPNARLAAFGQPDHVRLYGQDYADRLRTAGFSVNTFSFLENKQSNDVTRYGLLANERIYIVQKC